MKKDIFTYSAPWPIYSMGASNQNEVNSNFRFALGSVVEEYSNKVQIIELDEEKNELICKGSFDHPYPTTKIMWAPYGSTSSGERDLLATTGDYLRLWNVNKTGEVTLEGLLNPNHKNEFCAPLTSFDWSPHDKNCIGTSSIDTTCTIWDVSTKKVKTQLIAHDKEVYDFAWCSLMREIFGTVGEDGSLRLFDLRSLRHSTIFYETKGNVPLLRLAWNALDSNYIACFASDSSKVTIIDVRMPAQAAAELGGHTAAITGFAWAPHSATHMCSASDDRQTLIWDISSIPRPVEDPLLSYSAQAEVSNILWSSSLKDWVSIAVGDKFQILRV